MSSPQRQIKDICLRLLARREHSRKELQTKLMQRGFESMDAEAVIDELTEKGLQSDVRFAESYARVRLEKGFGSLKVASELKQRGIDNFDLKTLIAENFGDEQTLIAKVYQKKYAACDEMTFKERLKRQRFLLQRGFSHELISSLFLTATE